MNLLIAVLIGLTLVSCCFSKSVFNAENDSVVSVYTTPPTTVGTTASYDVYQQIANNIAERITSPIYRFFGIGKNQTNDTTTKRPWGKIELDDELQEEEDMKPVDNILNNAIERDIEELSVEGLAKKDKKPEKYTLYSSYLPLNEKYDADTTDFNDTKISDEDFDDFDLNDDTEPRGESVLTYILEWIGGFIQIFWGAVSSIFGLNFRNRSDSNSEPLH